MGHALQQVTEFEPVSDQNFHRIATSIAWLCEHYREQPTLNELARVAGLSDYHFQRLFTRWAGISPKRFSQFLTAGYAQQQLRSAAATLDVAYDAGLSGPSRLHNLFVNLVAMTPAQYRNQGDGLTISYGHASTVFGDCFIASTDRGICQMGFIDSANPKAQFDSLVSDYAKSTLVNRDDWAQALATRVFSSLASAQPGQFTLHVRGTNFQLQTWQALLATRQGDLVSYQQLADRIQTNAVRAAASAVAANPVAWLIPCHRVIRSTGALGQYRWGAHEKPPLLAGKPLIRTRSLNKLTEYPDLGHNLVYTLISSMLSNLDRRGIDQTLSRDTQDVRDDAALNSVRAINSRRKS